MDMDNKAAPQEPGLGEVLDELDRQLSLLSEQVENCEKVFGAILRPELYEPAPSPETIDPPVSGLNLRVRRSVDGLLREIDRLRAINYRADL